jgi:DNA adenine methylase
MLPEDDSVLKYGENGKGIKSRWYPATIARRIRAIASIRDRIEFIQGDGIEAIRSYARFVQTAMFIDPPYTVAGKKAGTRLYKYFQLDHERLFAEASKIKGDMLLTYDNAPEVAEFAVRHGFDIRTVAMKNTHHATMTELLIGRNLQWLK